MWWEMKRNQHCDVTAERRPGWRHDSYQSGAALNGGIQSIDHFHDARRRIFFLTLRAVFFFLTSIGIMALTEM
jgi:hypothetical protein